MRAMRPPRPLPEVVLVAAFALLLPLLRPAVAVAAPGLPILSSHGATILEGPGADPTLRFVVTLDRPATGDVTVVADTFPVTATSDADFVALTATIVTIQAGDTSTTIDVTVHDDAIDEAESEWFLLQLSDPVGADFGGDSSPRQYRGTIYDDELTSSPAPSLRAASPTVVEGDTGEDATLRYVVTLDRATDVPVSFQATTYTWTATAGVDFDLLPATTFTIDPGDTVATVDVTVHGDLDDEGQSEALYLYLDAPVGADLGYGSQTNVVFGTIIDDDDTVPPLARITVAQTTAVEGHASGAVMRFPIVLDRPSAQPVTVHVATRDGSAIAPDDYEAITDALVTFAPGDTLEEVVVPLVGDTVDEGDGEYLDLVLSDPVGADFGGYGSTVSYRGELLDDDGSGAAIGTPSVRVSQASIVEGPAGTDTALHFAVTLDRPASTAVSVKVQSIDGSATSPDDFEALPLTTLVFTAGQIAKDVVVPVHGDALDEGEVDYLQVELSTPTGITIDGSWSFAYGQIHDDEPTPIPPRTIRVDDPSVVEGDGPDQDMTFHVVLDRPATAPVTVKVSTQDGGASSPDDYDTIVDQTVVFAVGESVQEVHVTVHGDTVDEGNGESLYLTLLDPVGAVLEYLGVLGSGTIHDDDLTPTPAPELAIDNASLVEGDAADGTMTFHVSLDRPAPGPISVHVDSFDNDATVDGNDYGAVSTVVSFATGEIVKDLPVTVHGDTFDEGDTESFYLQLTDPVGAGIDVFQTYGYGIIWDDDLPNPGTLRFAVASISVNEADGSVWVEVDRVGGDTGAVSVDYATADVDPGANADEDYEPASGTLSWPANDVAPRTIIIDLLQDGLLEGPEAFTVALTDPTGGAVLGAIDTMTVTIFDDESDQPPTADAGDDATGDEGADIQLDGTAGDTENPTPSISWWATAEPGTDAGASCSFTPAGSADPKVRCSDDGAFLVTMSVFDGVNPPALDTLHLSIANVDPTVVIDAPTDLDDVTQGDTVELSATMHDDGDNDPLHCAIDWGDGTVEAGSVNGTACTGSHEYATLGAKAIIVTVDDDDGGDGDATIAVTVVAPPPPVPEATIGDRSVAEGDTGLSDATFTITLDAASLLPVSVHWSTSDGSAQTSDNDYIAGSGTAIIDPGGTSATVTVKVRGDRRVEPDETFSVTIDSADATVTDDTATGTITNDDAPSAPVLAPIGDLVLVVSDTLVVPITASDANGDALAFAATNLPGYATFTDHHDGSAELSLAPGPGDAGTDPGVVVTVSDGPSGGAGTLSDQETLTITVLGAPNHAPYARDDRGSTHGIGAGRHRRAAWRYGYRWGRPDHRRLRRPGRPRDVRWLELHLHPHDEWELHGPLHLHRQRWSRRYGEGDGPRQDGGEPSTHGQERRGQGPWDGHDRDRRQVQRLRRGRRWAVVRAFASVRTTRRGRLQRDLPLHARSGRHERQLRLHRERRPRRPDPWPRHDHDRAEPGAHRRP